MLVRRDASSDITIIRVETRTVTSRLSLTVSYVDITVTVPALSQSTLSQALLSQITLLAVDASVSEVSRTLASSLASTTQGGMTLSSAAWESYSSSLDTNLGLAIGIPMAVVALVAVLCAGWIIFRKVRSRLHDVVAVEKKWRAAADGSGSLGWVSRPDVPKRTLLNRLSRIVEWPASPGSFCPPILRRFHLLGADKQPVTPTPPPPPAEKPSATRVVVRPYAKRLGDELSIVAGQTVTLLRAHLDGWALVSVDGAEGVVPMACLKRQ